MTQVLQDKMNELAQVGVARAILDHLVQTIEQPNPAKLARLSPFRLADEWHLDRYDVLDAFLYGTRIGLTDLQWNLKCPSCRGPASFANNLDQLGTEGHCGRCQVSIDGSFDESVEVTFRVNDHVRDVSHVSIMEAIGSQLVFEDGLTFSADPGESQTIKLDLKPGHYFFTNSDFSAGTVMVVEGDLQDSPQHVIITYDGQTLQPGSRHYNPGQFSIEVVNTSPERAEVSFARSKEFPWVSGAIVASNQNFRDLFSTELIKPNASFSIQNLVLLFTDIKGSTEMYERLGDARAYALVREHFDILFEKTKSHHGAVVKTIGDAVMASFLSPVDAITSAMEMHKAFHEFNARDIQRDDIIIKVGIHRGPSIVVTSNDKLDYFGRTVNMAARVQGLSGGNDIMVSQSFFEQTGVASAVEQHGWHITPLKATLKGISGLVDVLHLTLPEQ